MPAPDRSLGWWIFWNCATWGAIFKAIHDLVSDSALWGPSLLLPSFALVCAEQVRRTPLRSRAIRVGSWAITLVGFAIYFFLLRGSVKSLEYHAADMFLAVTMVLPVLVLLAIWIQPRGLTLPFSWRRDVGLAVVWLIGLGLVFGLGYWVVLDRMAVSWHEKAIAKWTEIGRPMAEFEKSTTRVEENESFRILQREIQTLGIESLYKSPDPNPHDSAFEFPAEVLTVLNAGAVTAGDRIEPIEGGTPWLDAHAEQLHGIYRGILARESAVWGWAWGVEGAESGELARFPSAPALRKLAHLFGADAYRRIQLGDHAGAADAIGAGLKMSQSLREQPWFVSLMLRMAVEDTFLVAQTHLPPDSQPHPHFAADNETLRELLRRAIQCEIFWSLRYGMNIKVTWHEEDWIWKNFPQTRLMPIWMARRVGGPAVRLDIARTAYSQAECVALSMRPETVSAPTPSYVPRLGPDLSRMYLRIHASLIRREQAEVLRSTRGRILAQQSIDASPSVVVPGANWEITHDPVAHSVSLKLVPIPTWMREVTGPDYFILPLDGSKSWQLDPARSSGFSRALPF